MDRLEERILAMVEERVPRDGMSVAARLALIQDIIRMVRDHDAALILAKVAEGKGN